LIADDAPDNVTLLSRYMTSEGYDYITASNGVEALEQARLEVPDLILLDVNMPEKDGFTALRELRADPEIRHIPVIILTAARPSPMDIMGTEFGCGRLHHKPFDKRGICPYTYKTRQGTEDVIAVATWFVLPEIGRVECRLDINELTHVVLHRTVETLGAMMGHIILLDPKGPVHKKYYISEPDPASREVRFPPLNDLVDQIKNTRQGLIIDDTRTDPRWQLIPENPSLSMTIVPMFGRLDLIGLLILTHEKKGYFKLEHLLLLQAIASQASIAVENAQLYERMAQEQSRLSAVLQSAADAIMMFDADGCLSLLNPSAGTLFTDYETKLGLPLARNCGYDQLITALDDVIVTGKSKTEEILW
jgi:CheY-like chemotaxis protein